MAEFTMELRDLVELMGVNSIGLSSYPIFDEGYRAHLNNLIVDHYWFQEIAHESPDVFIHRMNTKMRTIMPFYNKLYESERIKFDPMSTMDISVISDSTSENNSENEGSQKTTGTEESSSENTTHSSSKSRAVQSDTPQVRLSGDEDYATGAADSVQSGDGSGTTTARGTSSGDTVSSGRSSGSGSGHSESRQSGRGAPGADMIMRLRETFLNIDAMVINELDSLFMGLWSNGSRTTDGGLYYAWR